MDRQMYLIFHYYDEEEDGPRKRAVSLYFLTQNGGNLSRTSMGREVLWNINQAPPHSIDISAREMTWEEAQQFNKNYS
ncbi:hypothetical protein LCGC14_1936380 [marine sediment metagenome]|uniref:Uncharacterized protein n=1 Tax=marine sediment metagenome TaxID=412755 RepID=A0A0F9FM02_9ZZZZ